VYSVIGLLSKPSDWSAEQFRDWWLHHHVPVVLSMPGLLDYRLWTVDHAIDQRSLGVSGDNAIDGVAVITFDSQEAFAAALRSAEGAADNASFNRGAPASMVLGGVPYVFREASFALGLPGQPDSR
jgi:uncharacterized protein (TIGR02118 family)